jgi:hypothetical protein
MSAPMESHRPSPRRVADTTLRTQGVLAGLFGALLLAAFFLYVDTVNGRPLFTPTLLAAALLGRSVAAPETLAPSLPLTLLFTAVHGLVFVAVGVGVAELLRFARVRSRGLTVVLVFGILCVTFFAFAAQVSAVGPRAVAVRDALLGNAVAALAMGAYLARNLPRRDR